MNLHQMSSGLIGIVNPFIPVNIKVSTGYTMAADGSQVPTYNSIATVGQNQALSGKDLQKLEGLNIQGVVQKMYLNGDYEGIFRSDGKGGDLMSFNGKTYLVAIVFERWPDWTAVGLSNQLDAAF